MGWTPKTNCSAQTSLNSVPNRHPCVRTDGASCPTACLACVQPDTGLRFPGPTIAASNSSGIVDSRHQILRPVQGIPLDRWAATLGCLAGSWQEIQLPAQG